MKRKRCDIAHIYHGATGNNGLYLDEIVQCLNGLDMNQQVYVSYHYPFNYGYKYFFKYTDLIASSKPKCWRPYARFLELCYGLVRSGMGVLRSKPKILNYSLIQAFPIEYYFLKFLKRFLKVKLVITCHDVVPFENKYMTKEQSIKLRQKVFDTADYLLVHNVNSIEDLSNYYSVDYSKVLIHSFPLMNLAKLYDIKDTRNYTSDFLFIGHMREEKGVLLLLEAWKIYNKINPTSTLIIAGNNPNHYDFSSYSVLNVTVIEEYLDDLKYCELIKATKFVILPYLSGTNSGVVSTVLGMGCKVICSNIPMFKNNALIEDDQLFEAGSSSALVDKMVKSISTIGYSDKNLLAEEYKNRFKQEVSRVYSKLMKK